MRHRAIGPVTDVWLCKRSSAGAVPQPWAGPAAAAVASRPQQSTSGHRAFQPATSAPSAPLAPLAPSRAMAPRGQRRLRVPGQSHPQSARHSPHRSARGHPSCQSEWPSAPERSRSFEMFRKEPGVIPKTCLSLSSKCLYAELVLHPHRGPSIEPGPTALDLPLRRLQLTQVSRESRASLAGVRFCSVPSPSEFLALKVLRVLGARRPP